MNESMSIFSLVLNASIVVQLVMLMLLLASVSSWVVIFQRSRVLSASRAQLLDFEDRFWSGADLNDLYRECQAKETTSMIENVFMAGLKEFGKMRQQSTHDPDAMIQGCQRAMRIAITRESEALDAHLPMLATVGSTSPYIGLFGTVWGIMNSFHGLASVKQATIATVAPGISEALVATAMGLLAAIPAVIFYNRFVSRVDHLTTGMNTFADEFSSLLYRQALRLKQGAKPAASGEK
ncbi:MULTISPECIES: protein TolQ [unclassified Oceanobacter]|uniref:protein TolQ n=1 Tax=unclassified Oceanobacter TaxID=2620260 RepID=UPI0026E4601E|nr:MULTISPECIES: protein TolQ [unclassified Oceanobacter]MDO6682786.1 protein TolQ [Oceanobacter sp. 5_MG-2023]MDP2504858.1 protein TolQ [Oceanobacter sp. 3_MG-2023]MDP2546302.1 protein TolQ [Oceanobacter sp. 4_MG-2023]MDP2607603.1 protein TolQ [Oceanobacter sp. 1_MG-2023]MDP2610871.1 protein TolQ [Oceanobacter sp. 2_MG-2023]